MNKKLFRTKPSCFSFTCFPPETSESNGRVIILNYSNTAPPGFFFSRLSSFVFIPTAYNVHFLSYWKAIFLKIKRRVEHVNFFDACIKCVKLMPNWHENYIYPKLTAGFYVLEIYSRHWCSWPAVTLLFLTNRIQGCFCSWWWWLQWWWLQQWLQRWWWLQKWQTCLQLSIFPSPKN